MLSMVVNGEEQNLTPFLTLTPVTVDPSNRFELLPSVAPAIEVDHRPVVEATKRVGEAVGNVAGRVGGCGSGGLRGNSVLPRGRVLPRLRNAVSSLFR